MKKATGILVIVLVIVLTLPLVLKPVVLSLVKKQLGTVFKDGTVSIATCRLGPVHSSVYGIEIKREPIYNFKAREVNISYRFFSLLRRRICRVGLEGLTVDINTPQKKILEFTQYLNLNTNRPSPFLINKIDLLDLKIKVKTKDIGIVASTSLGINLSRQSMDYLALMINSLDASGLCVEDVCLGAAQRERTGNFYVKEIKYNKVRIEDIGGRVVLWDKTVSLNPFSAKLLGGQIQGILNIMLDKNVQYNLSLNASGVDLSVIVNNFNLTDKLVMNGKIGGTFRLEGQGYDVSLMQGDFSVTEPGGMLTIKDEEFLKYLAKSTKQSLDMIVESFKEYQYNLGVTKLSLDKGDLILDIALDGEKGKRDLHITHHDFKLANYLIK